MICERGRLSARLDLTQLPGPDEGFLSGWPFQVDTVRGVMEVACESTTWLIPGQFLANSLRRGGWGLVCEGRTYFESTSYVTPVGQPHCGSNWTPIGLQFRLIPAGLGLLGEERLVRVPSPNPEQAALAWLEGIRWPVKGGSEGAPGEPGAERDHYGQVVLA
jgi:hypothetical protein